MTPASTMMKAASRKFRLSAKASKRCPGLIGRAASAVGVKVGVRLPGLRCSQAQACRRGGPHGSVVEGKGAEGCRHRVFECHEAVHEIGPAPLRRTIRKPSMRLKLTASRTTAVAPNGPAHV